MRVSIVASAFLAWVTRWLNRHLALMFSSAAPRSPAHPPPVVFPSDGPPTSWESNSTVRRRGEVCRYHVMWSFYPWSEISAGQGGLYIHTKSCGLFFDVNSDVYLLPPFVWKYIMVIYNLIYINFCIGDLSASDTSLVDLVERHRGPLPPELMPLPSSDRDSPLEWTHLVDVANTFESERNTHYGITNYKCTIKSFFLRGLSSLRNSVCYDPEIKLKIASYWPKGCVRWSVL